MEFDESSGSSLFEDVSIPDAIQKAAGGGDTAILHERKLLEGMPRPELIQYIEDLHRHYRSMEKDVSFLSWEFRDSLDNFTYFSRAASLAHKLNASDVEGIADIATREIPHYFSCDYAALFLYSEERMRFELCRSFPPTQDSGMNVERDDFLANLFSSNSYPFIAEYIQEKGIVELEGGKDALGGVPRAWTRIIGEKALVFPLKIKQPDTGEQLTLGGLIIGNSKRNLGEKDAEVSSIFSDLLASSLYTARLVSRLNALTIIDPLTQIYNRRHLINQLNDEMIQATRQGHPLSVAIADIDEFKHFNDRYGHLRGDEALRGVASTLKSGIRAGVDLAARYGGEEFMLVMPFTGLDAAIEVANRIRKSIKQWTIPFDGTELSVTCSFGVAEYAKGESLERLIDRADASLYQAKHDGRNRVCAALSAS